MNSRRRTITSISMVFLAVTILSVSALGQNAYAAMSLSVDADYDNGNISVSGDTDRTGDVTIKVTAENGNLVSVDQVTPSGGTYSSTIKVSLDGTYTVSAQQGSVSAYMLSVAVSSSEPSGTSSTGSTSSTSTVVTATTATTATTSGLSITAGGVEGSTTIDVSGTTDRGDDITLKVIAPNGNVITTAQLSPSGGSFMTTIETGGALWSQDGMYTISAYQGQATQYQASAEVEVIDGHVIPEFGTIAVMILVVAIVSIIIVSAKTKLSLVPKY
jgi:predicted secreted protein with PEFG-CTERM motif